MKQRDKKKLTKTIFKTDHSQIGQRNKYMSTRVILLRSVRGKPTIGEYVHTSYIYTIGFFWIFLGKVRIIILPFQSGGKSQNSQNVK